MSFIHILSEEFHNYAEQDDDISENMFCINVVCAILNHLVSGKDGRLLHGDTYEDGFFNFVQQDLFNIFPPFGSFSHNLTSIIQSYLVCPHSVTSSCRIRFTDVTYQDDSDEFTIFRLNNMQESASAQNEIALDYQDFEKYVLIREEQNELVVEVGLHHLIPDVNPSELTISELNNYIIEDILEHIPTHILSIEQIQEIIATSSMDDE
jgi:hypothetical protein